MKEYVMNTYEKNTKKKRELSLNQVIEELQMFARKNFPVQEVTEFFKTTSTPLSQANQYLFFSPLKYTRHLVHRSHDFELLYMCWSSGQKSPVHGHEGEKCWFRVEQGALQIVNYELNQTNLPKKISVDSALTGFVDGPADVHLVENHTTERAISLHLYARPFDACDVYDVTSRQVSKKKLTYDSVCSLFI
jgi:cysteine dioxygenase